MTIPGKGGRPRKWRSDADRVRAYRARQRGEPEPPVLAVALDQGDELADTWEQVRHLGEELAERREVEKSLRSELGRTRRELKAQQRRFGWILTDNDALREQLAQVRSEGDAADARFSAAVLENRALRQQLAQLLFPTESGRSGTPSPDGRRADSRAQRRHDARAARRRRS